MLALNNGSDHGNLMYSGSAIQYGQKIARHHTERRQCPTQGPGNSKMKQITPIRSLVAQEAFATRGNRQVHYCSTDLHLKKKRSGLPAAPFKSK